MQTLIQQLIDRRESHKISHCAYKRWRKMFVWHALTGQRFGQSFCQHFKIQDYRLQFAPTVAAAETIIQREWLTSG
jgi:hypothetical protein